MSLFVFGILYDIGIYKKCAVAATTSYCSMGVQFLLPKSINCEEKFWLRKGYTTSLRREEHYRSELTNHTTKINKLESWKKEIDDSIFRLNHFQNKNKDAMFVEDEKNRIQYCIWKHAYYFATVILLGIL